MSHKALLIKVYFMFMVPSLHIRATFPSSVFSRGSNRLTKVKRFFD